MHATLRITAILIIIVLPLFSEGQLNYHAYKKYVHEWEEPNPVPIEVNPEFANEDLVYLKDENIISFGGSLGSINNVLFQRHSRIKFITDKGIEKGARLTVPESYDPLYDHHNVPFRNNKLKKGPNYFELSLNQFAARIIKADGRVIPVEYDINFNEEETLFPIIKQTLTNKYVKNHFWNFDFKNLEKGDELEIFYQTMIPYLDNFIHFNTGRVFLNSEFACQNYSMVFKYKTGPTYNLIYKNNCEPDSTAIIDKTKFHYWSKKNLSGCLDEPGSRAYESAPYFIYQVNTRADMFRYNDPIDAQFKYVPYWLHIIRFRESFDFMMRKNAENNIQDKQNLMINKFINDRTQGIADTLAFFKFNKTHNFIADSFKYVNDEALFRETDIRAERIGEFTANHVIREVSRQKLYAKILNRLKIDYMTLYMMDNRYGKIDNDYQSPIWNNECLYTAFIDGKPAMVHPKKSDFGWYLEELPFFWENTTGLMVNLNDFYYDLLEKPRIIGTAGSSLSDNVRMNNVLATVDLNKKNIKFDARVNLSGQYSTMTRGLYTHNNRDSINNIFYSRKIYDSNSKVTLISQEITGRNTTFPFQFDMKCSYIIDDIVSQNESGDVSIDMTGWFNHIIYESLKTEGRQLDFYPDFVGQDTYRYYLKFNNPVEIILVPENSSIKNSLGILTINITQPQPDALLVESYFVINSDKVAAANIQDAATVFNAVSKLNSSAITVRSKP